MSIWLFGAVLLLWSGFVAAQDDRSQDELNDRGYIQGFLEDGLSDVGRDIRIIGFAGALSSRATIEQITIADDDGIWLTLNQVGLGWSRSSLLIGALDISELSAEEIILERLPTAVDTPPSPESTGFSLPELPISVEVAGISSPRIVIGEPVVGQAAVLRLDGDMQLSEGEGRARFELDRTDGAQGRFGIEGQFENSTRQLNLSLALVEGKDGIAANLIDLPGKPTVDMSIKGQGPLNDFTADLRLATDGEERLAGQVTLSGSGEEGGEDQFFSTNLSGDIAPVFLPEFRDFFGDQIALVARGKRGADGAMQLDEMNLQTEALAIQGNLSISAEGWPEHFALTGRVSHADGSTVRLPMSGPETTVQGMDLNVAYDSARGEDWRADMQVAGLRRPDLSLNIANLSAGGQLVRGDGAAIGQVLGDIAMTLEGITPSDPTLARAIGPRVTGQLSLKWQEDAPLDLTELALNGEDYQLTGDLRLRDFAEGGVLSPLPRLALSAQDLSRFAGLSGVDLSGAADLILEGEVNLLGGAFDLQLAGTGLDIAIGQPQFDPLVSGDTDLYLDVQRDGAGTRINRFEITSEHAGTSLTADLKTDASSGQFALTLNDLSRVEPTLSGPAKLEGAAVQSGDVWDVQFSGTGPGEAELRGDAELRMNSGQLETASGKISGKLGALSPYRGLVGQPVSGAIEFTVEGDMQVQSGAFTLALSGAGRDLAIGNPMLDPLIGGSSSVTAKLHRTDEEAAPILLDALDLTTPELRISATGEGTAEGQSLQFDATLRDLARVTTGISGPATMTGTAALRDQNWQIDLSGTGPNQANLNVSGQVAQDASRADLKLDGSTHLAMLNPLIRPRLLSGQAAFDLAVNGPLAVSSISGDIRVVDGQLILPAQQIVLDLQEVSVRLAQERAQINAIANVKAGGQITAEGSVGLTAPFVSEMLMRATSVHLSDGQLYDTTVDGRARLSGPLSGGAVLQAELALGPTEIRVPEAGPSAVPIIAELTHINEPAAVRRTRDYAGLIESTDAEAAGAPYPLDIRVSAPSRVFVRGRGLDAELGGELHLMGTSHDVVPQGQFNLIRGRLDILGKRLDLTEGLVSIQGDFDPLLRFVATSQTEDVDVRIIVEGSASEPDVNFTSSPERPQDEVLSLLLFGRSITQISPLQALRMAAAVRTLAGKGGEGIIGNLRGNFGLDDLDVTTDSEGVTNVRAGKYISENLYTDVTVGSDGTSEVNLNLNINSSLKARGSVTSEGESKLGIFFERDY
ncbi:translocation/assembly module TamB domain-containing protein [Aliiroseovarius sp. KMU-50]|uniref:Translocation/assembly module TamB domain-containing protein n=1 Tax=Aliiroseovarius salicola TaxID=3009082 RepID=A0ABT4W441_9RHOB|nr:translocation/assembly module TamB domain-containing protein [Aliiroseovarius sp. KMU-50]MDA5095295.1 translocation/assembly module TamB domain-containing protein [Aliiroseovarius sp. KMU-50]